MDFLSARTEKVAIVEKLEKLAIRGGSTVIIARVQNSKVCPRISIENCSKAWEGKPKEVYYSSLNAACKESGVQ